MSQRTEVRVKKTSERRSLRFAGLEFAPPVTAEERAEAEQVLADASASGDYSKVPPPREPTIAVWADEERHHYVLLGDEEGNPVAVRFKIGPVRDPRRDDMAKGGFVPAKTLQAMQPNPKQRAPGAGGGSGGGGGGGGGADAPAPLTEKQQKRKSELLQRLETGIKGLAQQGAGQLLGGLIKEGGSLGGAIGTIAGNAGQSLVGMGIGGLLSAGSDAFFSKVWGVDDSSSTGEQVAHHLAQELAGLMQAELQKQAMEGLFGKASGVSNGPKDWREQFTGIAAPDGLPMVRMGDKTDHGCLVSGGEATVLVEGQPAARNTDKIETGPSPHGGGTIGQGNPKVIVGGLEVARQDHLALCTGCGGLAHLQMGQASVQVGEESTPPPVAKPKNVPKVSGSAPSGSKGAGGPPGKQSPSKGGDAPSKESGKVPPDHQVTPSEQPDDRPLEPPSVSLKPAERASEPPGPQQTKDVSEIAYDAKTTDIGSDFEKDGRTYTVLDVREDPHTGFKAVVILDSDGKIGIGYAGTNDLKDVMADTQNALNRRAEQYEQALKFYDEVSRRYPEGVSYVAGHSLGGGEANYVGGMTGVPAAGINSAPLGVYHQEMIEMEGVGGAGSRIVNYNNAMDLVSMSPDMARATLNGEGLLVPRFVAIEVAKGRQLGTICVAAHPGVLSGLGSLIDGHLLGNFDPDGVVGCRLTDGAMVPVYRHPLSDRIVPRNR